MDLTVNSTYQYSFRCSTYDIWKHPTLPSEEISSDMLKDLPSGIDNLNITGGEPTLRIDLLELVDMLYPKARTLEISSNGMFPERLEPITQMFILAAGYF